MEGRRKEVLLLALALVALGLALYTFRGKPASAPPPAAPAAPEPARVAKLDTAQAPDSAEQGQQQAGTETPDAGLDAGAAQRNPFSTPEAAPAPTAPGPVPTGSKPAVAPDMPEWADSSLTLTGIVEGKPDVAILRQGDQRFFVKVGDPISGGYRVQSIGDQQVVLAGQQGQVILRMGGRQ